MRPKFDRRPAKLEDVRAIADGFQGLEEFAEFFKETHGLPFEGVFISCE